jgi:hypothetical protein
LLAAPDFKNAFGKFYKPFFMEKSGDSVCFRESYKMKNQYNQRPVQTPSQASSHTIPLQVQIDHSQTKPMDSLLIKNSFIIRSSFVLRTKGLL